MKIVSIKEIEETCSAAVNSERLRMNLNIHDSLEEPVHKMLNALQPGTILPIHRHLHPAKKETFVLIRGSLDIVHYNECREEIMRTELSHRTGNLIAEVYPEDWHSIEVHESDTVVLEIKQGPYLPFQEIDLLK